MLNKQYVSKRLLPIIVVFALAFGCMTVIHQSESYADEEQFPTTKLEMVGEHDNVTVHWYVLNNASVCEDEWVFLDTDYTLGDSIERTMTKDKAPWWWASAAEIEACGSMTGASLAKTDGSYIDGIYAADIEKGIRLSDLEAHSDFPENALMSDHTMWADVDKYVFMFKKDDGTWDSNTANYRELEDQTYFEVYTCDFCEAKEKIDTIITLYFNGEERKLRFDGEDEDMTLEVGEKGTRTAKTQSSYYSENAVISYASSDDSIATVDVSSGEVTGVAEGKATITASIQDGDKESSKQYKVIVTKASDPEVNAVIEKINSIIDDPVTLNSEEGITAARLAYNALEEEQKAMIDAAVLKKLTDAEEALKELKAAPVISQIDSIGVITKDNYIQKESDILDAQAAYNALNTDIQPFVTNYAKLLEARIAVAEFKLKDATDDLEKVKTEKKNAEQELQNLKDEIAAKALTVSGRKVASKAKKFTITWKKNAKADGYQVQYKLKSAKKYKNLKTLTGTKAVSKKLKKGKKYQFRVRTYCLVNGKTIYGKWSGIKTCVCK